MFHRPLLFCQHRRERHPSWVIGPLVLAIVVQALFGLAPVRAAIMVSAQAAVPQEAAAAARWAFWLDPAAICSSRVREDGLSGRSGGNGQATANAVRDFNGTSSGNSSSDNSSGDLPRRPAGHAHGDVCFLCPLGKLAVLPATVQVPQAGEVVRLRLLPLRQEYGKGQLISSYFARGPPQERRDGLIF